MTAPVAQQDIHAFQNRRFVINEYHQRALEIIAPNGERGRGLFDDAFGVTARHFNGKHRALADDGFNFYRGAQQSRHALDNRQPQTKAFVAIALGVIELDELLKNFLVPMFGNAFAAVPHFDTQTTLAAAAPHHHAALDGIANAVRNQIH